MCDRERFALPPADPLQRVHPADVLREIAEAVPTDCREFIVIIGSLAVGPYYFGDAERIAVRTKDADCLLSPRVSAVPAGVAIMERLLDERWTIREDERRGRPGTKDTSVEELPVVRLQPPGRSEWYIELLTVPESAQADGRGFGRLESRYGHFALCSFRYLRLTDFEPMTTRYGVRVPRPEMMALGNPLEHPRIGDATMSAGFAGRFLHDAIAPLESRGE